MKYFLLFLILAALIGCSKPNTTNGKFVGTWHQKGGSNDTVIFSSNGKLQSKLDMTLLSYSIISSDTMQINTTLSYTTHRSYYIFYSDTELGIQFFESNLSGFGYDSITLVKN